MEKKSIDIDHLYACILTDDFDEEYSEFAKYSYYFDLFWENYRRNPIDVLTHIDIFEKYYDKMERLDENFYKLLINSDIIDAGGVHTNSPIYAVALLFNNKYMDFSYEYYKAFKILASTCSFEPSKYPYINGFYEELNKLLYSKTKTNYPIDEERYRNLEFNYHMVLGHAMAYCYYMGYKPEKMKEIMEFFIKNYQQIINSFEVNGLTREDLIINKKGLSYFTEYYESNADKGTLKPIM